MYYNVLFRKIELDGKEYYQCEKILDDSKEFDRYMYKDIDITKDGNYFYYEIDQIELDNSKFIEGSFYDDLLLKVDDETLEKDLNKLIEKKYTKDLQVIEEKSLYDELIDSYVESISDKVFGLEDQVREIISAIIMNRVVNNSRLDDGSKFESRDSIILYGPEGNGKNTILNAIKDTLQVPIADIELNNDFKINLENIAKQLVRSKYKNYNEGIVIIRDNYQNFANDMENPFEHFTELLNRIKYYDHDDKELTIDFSKLTFITSIDIQNSIDGDLIAPVIADLSECDVALYIPELNKFEMKFILKSPKYSRIAIYNEMMRGFNKKIFFSNDAIDYLVETLYPLGGGLKIINRIIDKIVKDLWMLDEKKIYVNKGIVMIYVDTFIRVNKNNDRIAKLIEENEEKKSSKPSSKPVTKTNTSKSNNKLEVSKVDELSNIIKKAIRAQDDQVRRIMFTILRNRREAYKEDLNNPKKHIKNILLRGESGSGKTAILTEISKLLNIPIFIADATQYTENGFKGADVTDMLTNLYLAADSNLEEAERGILVIDEIDKKAATGGDIDVSRGAVLNSLLKIVEGCVMPIEIGSGFGKQTIQFDTSRLTVICSGAFENIEKIRDARLNKGTKKSMGFGSQEKIEEEKKTLDPNITDEDYVEFGMMRQFMARLPIIVNLNKLEVKDLVDIMKNSNLSELAIQKELYESDGIELVYTDEFYFELAEIAYNKKIGARGIEKALNDVFDLLRIENINPNEYSKVIFNPGCITDPSKLELVERNKVKVK